MLSLKLGEISVNQVMTPGDVVRYRRAIGRTHVSDALREYVVRIVRATRNSEETSLPVVKDMVLHGASPRSAQHLLALARTTAFFAGRDYILPADVKQIAPDALRHRLIRTVRAEAERVSTEEIIDELLQKVAIP
jgi:MoxR-like ATPase